MSKDSFFNILSTATSKSTKRLELLEVMKVLMQDYEEEELRITPQTRCEVLIKILNVTNPGTSQDELTYIENAILFEKGLMNAIDALNHYADVEIYSSKSAGSVSVVAEKISLVDSTNILKNLTELVNELIFSLKIDVSITLIVHNLNTSVETVDISASVNQTRIITIES